MALRTRIRAKTAKSAGIVTQTDFLEAIAGDLPDAQTEEPEVRS